MALFVLGTILMAVRGAWWLKTIIWVAAAWCQWQSVKVDARADILPMEASRYRQMRRSEMRAVLLSALFLMAFIFRAQHQGPQQLQRYFVDNPIKTIEGYATDVRGSGFTLWVNDRDGVRHWGKTANWRKIYVGVYEANSAWEGEWLELSNWKLMPFDQVNRTGFQAADYYASRHFEGALRASSKDIKRASASTQKNLPRLQVVRLHIQSYLKGRLTHLSPVSQMWLKALIFGIFDSEDTLGESVKALGVLHLCVVSGFHYALILQMFRLVTHKLVKRRKWSMAVDGLFAALVYIAAAPGFGSDRAHAKVQLRAVGFALKRNFSGHRGLLVMMCAWLMCFPTALTQVGFQVTFAASAALLLLSEWGGNTFKSIKSSLLKAVIESVFVVAFAMPLLMAHFVTQPALQVFATVILSPIIAALILLGILFLALGFGPVGGALALILDTLCAQTQDAVTFLLKGGALTWELPYPLVWQLTAISLGTLWLWSWPRGRRVCFGGKTQALRFLRGVGVLLLVVGMLSMCRVDFGFSMRTFALKDGEAYLLRASRAVLVYDVGNDPSILLHLKRAGVRQIDLLVISHADQDHRGQLEGILQAFEVKRVVEMIPLNTNGARQMSIDLGDLQLILGQYQTHATAAKANDASIALEGRYGAHAFLLTGDLEEAGMDWLISDFWSGKSPTVLKASHHGSYLAEYPIWLERLAPTWVWISGGRGKRVNKMPLKADLNRQGVRFYDTMEHGELYWGIMPWPIR